MRKIYSCIDISSNNIKILVVEKLGEDFLVLAKDNYPCEGMIKGVVVSTELFVKSLKKAIDNFKKKTALKIDKALITIGLSNVTIREIEASIKIISEDRVIAGTDITRLNREIQKTQIDVKEQLILLNGERYILDDNVTVKDPKGKTADKLKLKAYIATTPKKYLYSLFNAFHDVNIDVIDVCYNAVGDYQNMLDSDIDNYNGIFLRIDSETTSLSYFNKGVLKRCTTIDMGSSVIENELMKQFNISKKNALMLKEGFAPVSKRYASENLKLRLSTINKGRLELNQAEVARLSENKLIELIMLTQNEIKSLTKNKISYIIITGEVTKAEGFDYILDNTYGYIAKRLIINEIGIREDMYSASYGTIKYFDKKLRLKDREYSMLSDEEIEKFINKKYNA